jgi:hypothetical protein
VQVPNSPDQSTWTLDAPYSIYSTTTPGLLLGTIDSLNITTDPDPLVLLNFAVTAGGVATNFTITSSTVAFAPIVNGSAFASGSISVTDGSANSDGATAVGLFPLAKSFEAQYNGATSIFADLVSPVIVLPGQGSNSVFERSPPVAPLRTLVPGAVSDIESQFKFTLTALASAAGNGRFDIVPEPSSIVLAVFGLAAVVACARRRRR